MAASRIVLAIAGILATGCATVVHGRTQWVSATSEPAGAGVFVGTEMLGVTPARFPVKRRQRVVVVRFEKDGYRPAEVTLKRSASAWLAGDIAWGAAQFGNQGLKSYSQAPAAAAGVAAVTLGIDFATGAAYKLTPIEVRVMLEPVTTSHVLAK
jgi:PEGA domain